MEESSEGEGDEDIQVAPPKKAPGGKGKQVVRGFDLLLTSLGANNEIGPR
jgi:hypothetical protein